MRRRAIVVSALSFLIASAALAQTADLSVTVSAPSTASPGEQVKYDVRVANAGPDAANDIKVEPLGGRTSSAFCEWYGQPLAAGTRATTTCYMPLPESGSGVVGATVSFGGTDPNPANNTATASVEVVNGANLGLSLYAPAVVDPGLPFTVYASVFDSGIAADDTVLSFDLPVGSHVVTKPGNCTETNAHLVCTLGTIRNFGSAYVNFTVTAPDSLDGGVTIAVTGDVTSRQPDPHPESNHAVASVDIYRMFWVTDVDGYTLSTAINNVNFNCTTGVPCKIGFRFYGQPGPGGFFTIHPRAPLPRITAPVFIDGSTQTRYVGDTNPDGPEIFIDGSGGGGANGFQASPPCTFEMSSLAIGNFADAAIFMQPLPGPTVYCIGTRLLHDLYIGVDASGTKPAPNGRGIVYDNILSGGIRGNVISGNVRSGIWLDHVSGFNVDKNKIGLDAKGNPLGNGASGIFVGSKAYDTNVRDNFIAFNHDFGVAIAPGAYATYIPANAIYANWQIGIDVGIDGPTPEKSNAPKIISALYDPATDTTVITASVTPASSFPALGLHFYAADAPHPSGYGDGQYFLGLLQPIAPPFDKPVKFSAKGDLRGKWVCATETTNYYTGWLVAGAAPFGDISGLYSTTSEFSLAVKVE